MGGTSDPSTRSLDKIVVSGTGITKVTLILGRVRKNYYFLKAGLVIH